MMSSTCSRFVQFCAEHDTAGGTCWAQLLLKGQYEYKHPIATLQQLRTHQSGSNKKCMAVVMHVMHVALVMLSRTCTCKANCCSCSSYQQLHCNCACTMVATTVNKPSVTSLHGTTSTGRLRLTALRKADAQLNMYKTDQGGLAETQPAAA